MKAEINKQNYEAFLIDFMEGTLDEPTKQSVIQFLLENPDIKEEFDGLAEASFQLNYVHFDDKQSLKKTIIDFIPARFENIDEFFVAKLENDLSENEVISFNKMLLANPETVKELRFFEKTLLKPELNIVYPTKNHLKRSIIPLFSIATFKRISYYSAAAIVLFAMVFINQDLLFKSSEKSIVQNSDLPSNNLPSNNYPETQNKPNPTNEKVKTSETIIAKTTIVKPTEKQITVNSSGELAKTDTNVAIIQFEEQIVAVIEPTEDYNEGKFAYEIEYQSAGKTYTIDQYLLRQFRKKMLKESREEYNVRKFSGWDLVDYGVRQIGKLAGQDWQLKKDYNENGQLQSLAFNSRLLSFDYPLKK